MKKILTIRKLLVLGLAASLMMTLNFSCKSPSREVLRFSPEGQPTFYVTYLEKEIEVSSSESPNPDRFFLRNGEYFRVEDSVLFFSTVRDTVIDLRYTDLKYKITIERLNDDQYRTSCFFLREPISSNLFITYTYDSKYHIFQISQAHTAVYK